MIRDLARPVEIEERQLLQKNQEITHITRLFGGSSFVLGDDSGGIRILFTSRDPKPATKDGLVTKITGTFDFRPNEVHQEKKNQELQRFRLHQNRDFLPLRSYGIIRLYSLRITQ